MFIAGDGGIPFDAGIPLNAGIPFDGDIPFDGGDPFGGGPPPIVPPIRVFGGPLGICLSSLKTKLLPQKLIEVIGK